MALRGSAAFISALQKQNWSREGIKSAWLYTQQSAGTARMTQGREPCDGRASSEQGRILRLQPTSILWSVCCSLCVPLAHRRRSAVGALGPCLSLVGTHCLECFNSETEAKQELEGDTEGFLKQLEQHTPIPLRLCKIQSRVQEQEKWGCLGKMHLALIWHRVEGELCFLDAQQW